MKEILQLLKDMRHLMSFNKQALTVEELSRYADISVNYIYHLTATGKLKYSKPFGKKIYFDKNEIDAFLLQKAVASNKDREAQAVNYLLTSKKKF